LKVISRTSVMQYKGTTRSLPEIAHALGVSGIIEGSVFREADQVKIAVQLISAPSDTHVWAQDYVRDVRNVLVMQSEVARAIVKQVKAVLTPSETSRLAASKQVNPEAYDLYLRAKALPVRTQSSLKAIELYEQAIAADTGYAPAYGALSQRLIRAHDAGLVPRSDAFPRAQRAAERAIEIDPEDVDAMKAQFWVTFTILRDYAAADGIIRHILERVPNDAEAHSLLSRLLLLFGRFDEAVAEARHAVELDPKSVNVNDYLASAYYGSRRYDDCIEQAHSTLKLDANAWGPYGHLQACLDAKESYEEGAKAMERFWVLWGEDPAEAAALVTAQSQGGYRARVRAALAFALRQSKTAKVSYWGDLAVNYALLGDKDKAFSSLDQSYNEFDSQIFYLYEPTLDSLRDDPRWRALLRRLNLDQTPMAKLPARPALAAH
jgi:tetratricopeptide (TPR) repeat protein